MYCNPNDKTSYGQCAYAFTKGTDCDFDNQCASGLGCSRGTCKSLFSLNIGDLSDSHIFCETRLMNTQFYCDSIEMYVDGKVLESPFECDLGSTCVYKYKDLGTTFGESSCKCSGGGKGYCSDYVRYDKDIAANGVEHLKYTSSLCSGNDASTDDPDVLYECGSIEISNYEYYMNWTAVVNNWDIYNSHVIDECALDLGLFDPTWKFSQSLFFAVAFYSTYII